MDWNEIAKDAGAVAVFFIGLAWFKAIAKSVALIVLVSGFVGLQLVSVYLNSHLLFWFTFAQIGWVSAFIASAFVSANSESGGMLNGFDPYERPLAWLVVGPLGAVLGCAGILVLTKIFHAHPVFGVSPRWTMPLNIDDRQGAMDMLQSLAAQPVSIFHLFVAVVLSLVWDSILVVIVFLAYLAVASPFILLWRRVFAR